MSRAIQLLRNFLEKISVIYNFGSWKRGNSTDFAVSQVRWHARLNLTMKVSLLSFFFWNDLAQKLKSWIYRFEKTSKHEVKQKLNQFVRFNLADTLLGAIENDHFSETFQFSCLCYDMCSFTKHSSAIKFTKGAKKKFEVLVDVQDIGVRWREMCC